MALWALFLLLAAPVAHATADNCSSGQLPFSASVTNSITSTQVAGESANGSTTPVSITINCTSNWSAEEGTTCLNNTKWSLSPSAGNVTTTAFPNVFRIPNMPAGLGIQVFTGGGTAAALNANRRIDTGVPLQTGAQTLPLQVRIVKLDDSVAAGTYLLKLLVSCQDNEWANGAVAANSAINLTITTKLVTRTCVMSNANLPAIAAPWWRPQAIPCFRFRICRA
ncbi:hypothetical protein QTH91_14815 [Variovorax dokdonensis]|uniref:Spore coat protein U domain-containing protein n=1 Tax=Variovorax dokdonensis TaxID=344883 RepID=A0ABT7NCX1_9BURK|nr:fimbrial protein [Variovorax dokdonensis]MDM0045759.1 hypothetical protein [Variovorax dokdonensis]